MNQRKFRITLVTLMVLMSVAMGCQPMENENDVAIIVPESSATPIQPTPIAPTPTIAADPMNIRFGVNPFEIINQKGGKVVTSVQFSPDNNMLAMAGFEKISIVITKDLTILYVLEGHSDFLSGLVWTPDGENLLSASLEGRVILWETENFSQAYILETGPVFSVDISPDGSNFITGGEEGKISIWDLNNGNLLNNLMSDDGRRINSVKYSPDGKMIASGNESGFIEIWDADSGMVAAAVKGFETEVSEVNTIDWSFDGSFLASGNNDGEVFVFNSTDWTIYNAIGSQIDWVSSVNWVPNNLILTVTGGSSSNSWNIVTMEEVVGVGGVVDYFCADWAPNGRYLALGSGGLLMTQGIASWFTTIKEEAPDKGYAHLWVRID